MAMHTTSSTTEDTKRRYKLKPTAGVFEVYDYETKQNSQIASVEGDFVDMTIIHDPGTPASGGKEGYDPYDALWIRLDDGDESYRIKVDVKRTFAWNFAACLHAISKGDRIKLDVKKGDKKPKVTLLTVFVWDTNEGKFKFVAPEPIVGSSDEKGKIGEELIRNHPAFVELNTDSGTEAPSQEE